MNRRPQPTLIAPDVSPDEAAAVVAAITQFLRDTAPHSAPPVSRRNPWQLAALHEGVERAPAARPPWG